MSLTFITLYGKINKSHGSRGLLSNFVFLEFVYYSELDARAYVC